MQFRTGRSATGRTRAPGWSIAPCRSGGCAPSRGSRRAAASRSWWAYAPRSSCTSSTRTRRSCRHRRCGAPGLRRPGAVRRDGRRGRHRRHGRRRADHADRADRAGDDPCQHDLGGQGWGLLRRALKALAPLGLDPGDGGRRDRAPGGAAAARPARALRLARARAVARRRATPLCSSLMAIQPLVYRESLSKINPSDHAPSVSPGNDCAQAQH